MYADLNWFLSSLYSNQFSSVIFIKFPWFFWAWLNKNICLLFLYNWGIWLAWHKTSFFQKRYIWYVKWNLEYWHCGCDETTGWIIHHSWKHVLIGGLLNLCCKIKMTTRWQHTRYTFISFLPSSDHFKRCSPNSLSLILLQRPYISPVIFSCQQLLRRQNTAMKLMWCD